MSEPVRIVVALEGGLIQSIHSLGAPVEVLVIDSDTDGADSADLTTIGTGEDAYLACVSLWRTSREDRPDNLARITDLFTELRTSGVPA